MHLFTECSLHWRPSLGLCTALPRVVAVVLRVTTPLSCNSLSRERVETGRKKKKSTRIKCRREILPCSFFAPVLRFKHAFLALTNSPNIAFCRSSVPGLESVVAPHCFCTRTLMTLRNFHCGTCVCARATLSIDSCSLIRGPLCVYCSAKLFRLYIEFDFRSMVASISKVHPSFIASQVASAGELLLGYG